MTDIFKLRRDFLRTVETLEFMGFPIVQGEVFNSDAPDAFQVYTTQLKQDLSGPEKILERDYLTSATMAFDAKLGRDIARSYPEYIR